MVTDIYMDLVGNPIYFLKEWFTNTLVRTTKNSWWLGVVVKKLKFTKHTQEKLNTDNRRSVVRAGGGGLSKLDKGIERHKFQL